MVMRLALGIVAAVVAAVVTLAAQDLPAGIGSGDPHLRPDPVGAPDLRGFDRIGDMLVWRGSGTPTRDLQTAYPTVPTNDPRVSWSYGVWPTWAWDFGVLPVAFVPEVTEEERTLFWSRCAEWGAIAPVMCVPRTTQTNYLEVRKDPERDGKPSPCFSTLGAGAFVGRRVMNLPGGCFNGSEIHELGHAFGLTHEHQRPDRDGYIAVDYERTGDSRSQYEKYDGSRSWHMPAWGPYDFLSVMHYGCGAPGSTAAIAVLPPFAEYGGRCGSGVRQAGRTRGSPTELDLQSLLTVYHNRLVWGVDHAPRFRPVPHFERDDFLAAMERLHAFYMSRQGLQRPEGLSIRGRPDFLGIAAWIFDIYLGARSAGWHHWAAFDIVVSSITQTEEWRTKNPTLRPIQPDPFTPAVRLDRNEFLATLQRLDAYYASAEGLQRPNGLSIAGGPDFLGIATWVFDVYLAERMRGASPNAAWLRVVGAIERTDEWRQKHGR